MLLLPRSSWTGILPKPTPVGEDYKSLNYFTEKPSIEYTRVDKDMIFLYRDPQKELNFLLKEHRFAGLSDLNYNFAISQITRAIYTVRGSLTRCAGTESLRVLMLLGNQEKPTDVLKENQAFFEENYTFPVGKSLPLEIPTPKYQLGDRDIHVFDLIELLTKLGAYNTRNDGYYGPLVENSIKTLQDEYGLQITGIYDKWLEEKLTPKEYLVGR